MKAFFRVCFAAALLFLVTGCSQPSGEDIVLPPTRIGTDGEMSASLSQRFTFDSAFSEADAVAHIRVGNWLAEDSQTMSTYYCASTVQVYKGELPESFTLYQDGNASHTIKGYPLFTYGNELFVFLKQAEYDDASGHNYENGYWIIGSFSTFLDVVRDESGERYYMDRYGALGETMSVNSHKIMAYDLHICDEDEILYSDGAGYSPAYIFSEQDMSSLIERRQETA